MMAQGCFCRRMGDVFEWIQEAAPLREGLLQPMTVSQCALLNDFLTHPSKDLEDCQGQGGVDVGGKSGEFAGKLIYNATVLLHLNYLSLPYFHSFILLF